MANYTVEQFVKHANQFEPVDGGDFDTEYAAKQAMNDLEKNCGYSDLRVVDAGGTPLWYSES